MSFQDKTLTCSDCSRSFVFSAVQQGLSGELGYDRPTRCRSCGRSRELARRDVDGAGRGEDVASDGV